MARLGPSAGRGDLLSLWQDNDYRVLTLDLTQARTNAPLGVWGTSLTVMQLGGAAWSLRLGRADADEIPSTALTRGSRFDLAFEDVYITNAAAPAGTEPVVLFVGRRA